MGTRSKVLPFLKRRILLYLINRALQTESQMKVLAQTSSKNVPTVRSGRVRNTEHDNLAAKISSLKRGKVLPVECEDEREVTNLTSAIRRRLAKNSVRCEVRGNIVYFSLKG